MEATEKQPDQLNMLGVIVVGLSGALLVYATFIALQAYYVTGASALQAQRESEGIDMEYRSLQAKQQSALQELRWVDQGRQIVTLPIEDAMQRVVEAAKADPAAALVPAVGAHDTPTVPAIPGRPDDNVQMPAATPPAAPEAGAAAAEGTAAVDVSAVGVNGGASHAAGEATPGAAAGATGAAGGAAAEATGEAAEPAGATAPDQAPGSAEGNGQQ